MLDRNLQICLYCKYYNLTGDSVGFCSNKRLSDIERKYFDSLQPDLRYRPQLIFRVCATFGCIHYNPKPQENG